MPESVHWDDEIFKDAREAAGKLPPEVRYRPLGAAAKGDFNAPDGTEPKQHTDAEKR
jgi:hypothetical protein